jgi:antitoxin component YwqK of YwqJK toxin-antitoxin module
MPIYNKIITVAFFLNFALLSGCASQPHGSTQYPITDGNILKNTEPKERIAAVLVYKDDIAFMPNEDKPFTGKYELYYPNGNKKIERNYLEGKHSGLSIFWYENGQKDVEGNFKDGYKNGLFTLWDESGNKISENNYINGHENGLVTIWYDNGIKRLEIHYLDGKKHGLYTMWDKNGQKQLEANYTNDKENGILTLWHENGLKKGEINYQDGKRIGIAIWNESGQEIKSKDESKDESKLSCIYKYVDVSGHVFYSVRPKHSGFRLIVCNPAPAFISEHPKRTEKTEKSRAEEEYHQLVRRTAKFLDDVEAARKRH